MRTIKNFNHIFVTALALVMFLTACIPGYASADSFRIGDTVTFGIYEQNNNLLDGAEPLEWLVLDTEEDRILVITKNCIDSVPYNTRREAITWENCSLRSWLNNRFFKMAFNAAEQSQILTVINDNPNHPVADTNSGRTTEDKVFILNLKEAETYFTSYASRMAAPTAYAMANGTYRNPNTYKAWWYLRTPSYTENHACYVTSEGGVVNYNGRELNRTDAGVRPVMWISITE